MPVPSPHAWAVLIFGDQNALVDFLGAHDLSHVALDRTIRAAGGAPYPHLPLGNGPTGDGADWMEAHQAAHAGAASSLGIAAAPDLRSYTLNDPEQFASWTWLHAQEHVRINDAAGL